MNRIYLDNAASTEVKKEVLQRLIDTLAIYGNPSSAHYEGQKAKEIIDNTSKLIGKKLNCKPEELYYTSGATMSNNVAIQGFFRKHPNGVFITFEVEHNDIIEMYNWLPTENYLVRVDGDGYVDMENLTEILKNIDDNRSVLVSIQAANSESGVIQDIKQISDTVHQCHTRAVFHTDATQYIPHFPVDVQDMGIDMLSMSGQKIGGVKGSGLLYISEGVEIESLIFGEQGIIGGTPAVPLIASLGTAFENIDYSVDELVAKRNWLIDKMQELGGSIVGAIEHRLPNNVYVRFAGVDGMQLMSLLDGYDICVGTGSACSTASNKPSHVAMALGLSEKEANECIRLTIGSKTTYEELEYAYRVIRGILMTIGVIENENKPDEG